MSVRVRYAPSPTGLQHIGGIRTALFNYFFARANGGKFILRIEDTDQERYYDEALQDLYDTFAWLGIHWDEGPDVGGPFGPYVQSQRVELYREYAKKLVDDGKAYYCYCTPERLDELRKAQTESKASFGYDRHCRSLTSSEIADYEAQGIKPVIRLAIPLEGSTTFHDELLGDIERENKDVSPDPVLLKSDGFPTYHLANVIDDHLMQITHIMRAQEWIPSGPLHILLYRAFGWEPPKYCHLPMVMGSDGQKLSKRHGATSVREFIKAGYLPEAIINYISLIGWSYDDTREFFSKEELEKLFTPEKLNKAPGVFDYKKLEWFNGQYIRMKDDGELAKLFIPYLLSEGLIHDPQTEEEETLIQRMIPLVKERLKFISEVPAVSRFLFAEPGDYPQADLIPKKLDAQAAYALLETARPLVDALYSGTDEEAEEAFKKKAEETGAKLGDLLMPVRVAVTGSRVSPPLFGSLRVLGREKSLKRIDRALELLKTGA